MEEWKRHLKERNSRCKGPGVRGNMVCKGGQSQRDRESETKDRVEKIGKKKPCKSLLSCLKTFFSLF